jgi:hypothetical protein
MAVDNEFLEDLSRRWRAEGATISAGVNEWIQQSIQGANAKPPEDTRADMATDVLKALREANHTAEEATLQRFREMFPPAHAPFMEMLKRNGQDVGPIALLDDGRILARIGGAFGFERVAEINGLTIKTVPDVLCFGRSPNDRYFAAAKPSGVEIRDGWDGPVIVLLAYPTGQEGMPDGFTVAEIEPVNGIPPITRLIPFPAGDCVLLVSPYGIFVLTPAGPIRLHLDEESLRESFEWQVGDYPNDPLRYDVSMEHAAMSRDGRWIALGSQDSHHLIFDANFQKVGDVGPICSYPHFAAFSEDGETLLFNACHFYNGDTLLVPTHLLPNLTTEAYSEDERLQRMQTSARIYAVASHGDEFIIGDAYGYIAGYGTDGKYRWQHHLGSTICEMALSGDGKTLVVSTYAGIIHLLRLDMGEADPFAIGTATHQEVCRWLFWKEEERPLVW